MFYPSEPNHQLSKTNHNKNPYQTVPYCPYEKLSILLKLCLYLSHHHHIAIFFASKNIYSLVLLPMLSSAFTSCKMDWYWYETINSSFYSLSLLDMCKQLSIKRHTYFFEHSLLLLYEHEHFNDTFCITIRTDTCTSKWHTFTLFFPHEIKIIKIWTEPKQ